MTKWRISDYRYHYTYITRCSVNGKYYKGRHSSNTLDDRYLGSGVQLKKDIRKYGKKVFTREVVKVFSTLEDSWKGEEEFITQEDVDSPNCYNVSFGGIKSKRFTPEMRKRASERQCAWAREHGSPRLGIKASAETIQKQRDYHSRPEVKARDRAVKMGSLNPMFGMRGALNATSKPVLCVELDKVYESAMIAAREHGVDFQNISKVCKGERHTCGGYHWKFV